MVQVLPYVPSFGEKLVDTLSQAAGNATEGYFQGQRKKSDLKLIEEIGNNPNDAFAKQYGRINKLSPEAQKTFVPLYSQLMKGQNISQENQLNRDTQLEKARIMAAAKGQKQNVFDQTIQRKNAEEYIKLNSEIPKVQETLKTIDELDQLSHGFSGVTGWAQALVGAGGAAEFDSRSALLLEPLLKVFNPVGAIPTQKIKLLQERSIPKSTDPQWMIDGKLKAAKRQATSALQRAEQRRDLIKQYGGSIPEDVEKDLNKQDEIAVDQYNEELQSLEKVEQKTGQPKDNFVNELPSKGKFVGQIATDTDSGQKYLWNGSHWSKQ